MDIFKPLRRCKSALSAEFWCVDGTGGASGYPIHAQRDHGFEQTPHPPLYEAACAAAHARVRHI